MSTTTRSILGSILATVATWYLLSGNVNVLSIVAGCVGTVLSLSAVRDLRAAALRDEKARLEVAAAKARRSAARKTNA